MLVLANGAPKSGSTWLRNIIRELRDFDSIPPAYLNPGWSTPTSIAPNRFADFLRVGDYQNFDILSKNHIASRRLRDLLLSFDGVYVVNLSRDLRDAITSHYHHFRRQHGVEISFRNYYRLIGRYKAVGILEHLRVWEVDHPRVHITSFEELRTDFERVVTGMAEFLGVDLSPDEVKRIRTRTSLVRQREQWDDADADVNRRFFRKGEIGDYRNWVDDRSLEHLERLMAKGPRRIEHAIYRVLFPVRHSVSPLLRRITRRD